MKLAQTILDNERKEKTAQNTQLVRIKLKELVFAYPNEIVQVLHKTGIAVSTVLPANVLYAIVVKNLESNSELREAIAKTMLEQDGYASADGQGWQLIGGSLSALGSVLAGIGRGQNEQSNSDAKLQQEQMQQQLDLEKAKRVRTTWLIIGISAVVLIGVILGVRAYMKSKAIPKPAPKLNPAL